MWKGNEGGVSYMWIGNVGGGRGNALVYVEFKQRGGVYIILIGQSLKIS